MALPFPLRRVVDRFSRRYVGWIVRLDCGHEQTVDRKTLSQERRGCVRCLPGENSAVERAPLRDIAATGIGKDGSFETLSCGHTLYGVKGRAKQRRCEQCLEDAR